MGRRKQNNSRRSQTLTSSSHVTKAIFKDQSKARQLEAMEIEENEYLFSHFTDKIQQQLDLFQDKSGHFWKKESLKKGLIERNMNKKEVEASQPAVHLNRDEPSDGKYESKRREAETESFLKTEIYL